MFIFSFKTQNVKLLWRILCKEMHIFIVGKKLVKSLCDFKLVNFIEPLKLWMWIMDNTWSNY